MTARPNGAKAAVLLYKIRHSQWPRALPRSVQGANRSNRGGWVLDAADPREGGRFGKWSHRSCWQIALATAASDANHCPAASAVAVFWMFRAGGAQPARMHDLARDTRAAAAGAAGGGSGRRPGAALLLAGCLPVCHWGWLGGGGGCWCRRGAGRRCAVGRGRRHLRCSALLCSGPCMRRQLARVADGYLQLSTLLRTSPKAKTVALQLASLHKHHLPRRVWPPACTTGRARPCQAASGCRLID